MIDSYQHTNETIQLIYVMGLFRSTTPELSYLILILSRSLFRAPQDLQIVIPDRVWVLAVICLVIGFLWFYLFFGWIPWIHNSWLAGPLGMNQESSSWVAKGAQSDNSARWNIFEPFPLPAWCKKPPHLLQTRIYKIHTKHWNISLCRWTPIQFLLW